MSQENTPTYPMPMRGMLLLIGMYTFAWAAFFRYFGPDLLRWLSLQKDFAASASPTAMGSVGMLVGFLIFLSAFYPISWRYLTFAGIIGKMLILAWFLGQFLPELGWNKRTIFHVAFTEIFWMIPLIVVFIRALKVKKYLENQT
jgi:hypothetical protein